MTCTAINMPETVSVALLVIAGQFGNGFDPQALTSLTSKNSWF